MDHGRGAEMLGGSYCWLDLTAFGRQEEWEESKGRADKERPAVPDFSARRVIPTAEEIDSVAGGRWQARTRAGADAPDALDRSRAMAARMRWHCMRYAIDFALCADSVPQE